MSFRKGTYYIDWCDSDGVCYERDVAHDLEQIWKNIIYGTYHIRTGLHVVVWEDIEGIFHEVITAMFAEGQPYRVIHSCLDNGDRPGFTVWGFKTCEEA